MKNKMKPGGLQRLSDALDLFAQLQISTWQASISRTTSPLHYHHRAHYSSLRPAILHDSRDHLQQRPALRSHRKSPAKGLEPQANFHTLSAQPPEAVAIPESRSMAPSWPAQASAETIASPTHPTTTCSHYLLQSSSCTSWVKERF